MTYDPAFLGGARSGLYAAPPEVGGLRAACGAAGLRWFDLDLDRVADRESFLERCGQAFGLPAHYGRNWDALHECLRDLFGKEASGAVVHWHGGARLAQQAPEVVDTALDILSDAAMYWESVGQLFVVAMEPAGAPGRALPPLGG